MKVTNKNQYKAHSSTKKLFLMFAIVGIILFLVGSVSALKISYEKQDMKVIFKKSFLGVPTSKIGTIELKSHKSVNEIKEVNKGNSVVMWYEINWTELRKDDLGEVKFIDVRKNKQVIRDYEFVYWKESVCNEVIFKNNTKSNQCSIAGWLPYNSKDIPKGKITIGIKVKVYRRDYIDGVWNIAGKEISKHATWTETGVENYDNFGGGADIQGATITLTQNVNKGFLKAMGIIRGDGSLASVFQVHVNQSGDNIATGTISIAGIDNNIEYVNFTDTDYSRALNSGTFTIDIHRISGDILFQRGVGISYSGSLFSFSSQIMPLTGGIGTTLTYGEVSVAGLELTLNSPENSLATNNKTLIFNASVLTFGSGLGIANVTLNIDGIVNETNSSGVNGTYIFTKIFEDGSYNWSISAFDNESLEKNTTTRTFSVDSIPPNIDVVAPQLNFNLLSVNQTLFLNFTATDFANSLDSCLYDYNGTNLTASCSNGTQFKTTLLQENNNFNVTVYVNDTAGNINSSLRTWDFKFFEINNTFSNTTTGGNLENYFAFGTLGQGLTISEVNFVYNGNVESGDSFLIGSTTVLRKLDFFVPNLENNKNVTFYWNITLSDSTKINLTFQNQTVNRLEMDNCSSFTNEILNFTLIDEETQVQLNNVTIETANNIYTGDRSNLILNFSEISNSNPTRVCLNVNLTTTSNYSLDVVVRYENPTSAIEYYNIVNFPLTLLSQRQDIKLYDLNISDSTDFQLTFTGSDFLPIEGALVFVDRQYISENLFKTVELPKTDSNGQAVLHLVRNDVIYNIRVIKDNVVLGNFENLVAFCDDFTIGDCNVELNAFDSVVSIFDYNRDLGIIFNPPQYNKTSSKITFNFVTTNGDSKTIILNVTRNDIFGNNTICETSLISSGGTLVCDIDPKIDDSVLKTEIYVDGSLVITSYVELDSTNFGVAGYLIMFIMAMSFILMFAGSKTGVLVSIGISVISSSYLGLTSGSLLGLGASGLWIFIILIIGIYKLNAENTS